MVTPSERLAESLEVLHALHKAGSAAAIRARDLTRTHCERLVATGFLREVIRGWYIPTRPDEAPGESTAWFAAFWTFAAAYLEGRFGRNWSLSPNQSISLHGGNWAVPRRDRQDDGGRRVRRTRTRPLCGSSGRRASLSGHLSLCEPHQAAVAEDAEPIVESFPNAPGLPRTAAAYMKGVGEAFVADAYHSLSIEGYRVSSAESSMTTATAVRPSLDYFGRRLKKISKAPASAGPSGPAAAISANPG
jgi:hypothetical protein